MMDDTHPNGDNHEDHGPLSTIEGCLLDLLLLAALPVIAAAAAYRWARRLVARLRR